MDNRRQVEALRAANRGMARAVCQGAKTAKRYAALGAGMEVDAQGYGREPTAMVRGVLSCLFVCLFVPNPKLALITSVRLDLPRCTERIAQRKRVMNISGCVCIVTIRNTAVWL